MQEKYESNKQFINQHLNEKTKKKRLKRLKKKQKKMNKRIKKKEIIKPDKKEIKQIPVLTPEQTDN